MSEYEMCLLCHMEINPENLAEQTRVTPKELQCKHEKTLKYQIHESRNLNEAADANQ